MTTNTTTSKHRYARLEGGSPITPRSTGEATAAQPAWHGRQVGARWWEQWPTWIAYAAAAWSLVYAILGLYWAAGGAGFPFGSASDRVTAAVSILGRVQPREAGSVLAALGGVGGAVGLAMARRRGRGLVRAGLLIFAGLAALTLALLIPDYRVLVVVAYAPVVVLGAPFGFPPETDLLALVTWPLINQLICMGGGALWTAAAVAYARQTGSACAYCGRDDEPESWTAPAAAARWGRWAVYVAVGVPLIYAFTRWTWALGIPLGINERLLREGQATGLWWAGAALATVAVAGALLTFGLIRPWGEIFPRWLPLLGGRRVPLAAAVAPALLVAMLVTNAGMMYVRKSLSGGFRLGEGTVLRLSTDPAAVLPELLWPIWGLALTAAALAYYYRRRGPCPHCGRGHAGIAGREGPLDTLAAANKHRVLARTV